MITNHPPAITLTSLTKQFGAVTALAGIDLTVEPGQIVALLGPNGAGKTTTLDAILGFLTPTAGTAEVFGGDPASAIARGRIAAVMQEGGLLGDLTVLETVQLVGSLYSGGTHAHDAMARAGIVPLARRRVAHLSGGERQRLRFALALLPDPDLLILDEPTTGMDVGARREFWAAIRSDAARGRTVVFATHYLAEADEYAERIVLMAHGRLVADGTPNEVKATASGRLVRATIPDAEAAAGLPDRLAARPDVTDATLAGCQLEVRTQDSDAIARYLLTSTAARDLEIVSANLEDAFVALTSGSEQ